MKIVCDACSAKYSIADEKVRGKVFKIRCKKCSNIIVVRGQASEQPAATYDQKETKVFDYSGYESSGAAGAAAAGDDVIWHLVIDQEQVGPMTADEVRQRFQRGEIDAESYVWREGFADWERLADVSEFAGLMAGNGSAADGGLFGGGPSDDGRTVQSDPGDLFAARGGDEADAGSDLFGGGLAAASSSSEDDGGLFGSSSSSSGGGAMAAAAAPAPAPTPTLTGQRNENSVLFSLNNLAALASDSPRSSNSSSLASGSSSGMAQNEGSGLIDIRSMAQVYLGENKQSSSKSVGSIDDLPVFSQTSFEAASPVLLPTAQPAVNNRLLIALVALIGVLVIAAVVLVIVVLRGGGDDDDRPMVAAADPAAVQAGAAGSAVPPPAAGGAAASGAADQAPAAGSAEKGDEEKAAEKKEEKADGDDKRSARESERREERRSERRESRRSSSRSESKPEPERKPVPDPTASSGCDEVTCLVEPDKPCCRKGGSSSRRSSSGSSSSSANSNLPESPSRADVSAGIAKIKSRVKACNGSGTITARIKISPSGTVSSASASGGSPSANACVERAVKKARFPKTQRGVTVNYPFVF